MFWKKSGNHVKDESKVEENNPASEFPEADTEDIGEKDVNLISFFGPFIKNYASTLSNTKGNPGRLPYPPRFYIHASSLQHTMALKLNHIGLLELASQQPDPQSRFLGVLKYFFSVVSLTKFPYKPIIAMEGETSHHFVNHGDGSHTYAIAEEIVHDPPYCAFYMINPEMGVVHDGNVALEPKFEKGHVRVHIAGYNRITFKHPQGLYEEVYENTVPDLMVRLLRMHTECIGDAVIACRTTGYAARLNFKEKPLFGGSKNSVSGSVTLYDREIFRLDGAWDECIYITDLSTQQRMELLNRKVLHRDRVETPPMEALPATAGEKIWGPLIDLLKQENYTEAQTLKLQMNQKENAERQLRKQNNVQPDLFYRNPTTGFWEIKNPGMAATYATAAGSASA